MSNGLSTKNCLVNASLVVASVVLALGVAELYLREFQPQSIIPRYVETSPHGIRKNIGNVNGVMITPEYRHQFHTNAQGFRGTKNYATPKPAGTYRIIVLGDSVTLGHGVEDDETFAAILERNLSLTRPMEVINMGVSGFGTAEELIQLRSVGWHYEPDLVVLAYFPNDPYNNVVSGLFNISEGKLVSVNQVFEPAILLRDRLYSIPGYSFLCQHSHVVNFVRNQMSGFFIEQLGRQHHISSQTSETLTPKESELTGLLLTRAIVEVSERHVPLIIVNIPLVHQGTLIDNIPRHLLPQQDSVPLYHLMDAKNAIYASYPLTDLSYGKDAHPTPYAHRLIGDWLSQFIKHDLWHVA